MQFKYYAIVQYLFLMALIENAMQKHINGHKFIFFKRIMISFLILRWSAIWTPLLQILSDSPKYRFPFFCVNLKKWSHVRVCIYWDIVRVSVFFQVNTLSLSLLHLLTGSKIFRLWEIQKTKINLSISECLLMTNIISDANPVAIPDSEYRILLLKEYVSH